MAKATDPKSRQALMKQLESDGVRSEHFNSRELSWLEFNARVLEEARDAQVPLLERLKFLGIFSSNLDEFFMIRVAGVKHQISAGVDETGFDGLTPNQTLEAISKRVHELTGIQHRCYNEELRPLLEAQGVNVLNEKTIDEKQREFLGDFFRGLVVDERFDKCRQRLRFLRLHRDGQA